MSDDVCVIACIQSYLRLIHHQGNILQADKGVSRSEVVLLCCTASVSNTHRLKAAPPLDRHPTFSCIHSLRPSHHPTSLDVLCCASHARPTLRAGLLLQHQRSFSLVSRLKGQWLHQGCRVQLRPRKQSGAGTHCVPTCTDGHVASACCLAALLAFRNGFSAFLFNPASIVRLRLNGLVATVFASSPFPSPPRPSLPLAYLASSSPPLLPSALPFASWPAWHAPRLVPLTPPRPE